MRAGYCCRRPPCHVPTLHAGAVASTAAGRRTCSEAAAATHAGPPALPRSASPGAMAAGSPSSSSARLCAFAPSSSPSGARSPCRTCAAAAAEQQPPPCSAAVPTPCSFCCVRVQASSMACRPHPSMSALRPGHTASPSSCHRAAPAGGWAAVRAHIRAFSTARWRARRPPSCCPPSTLHPRPATQASPRGPLTAAATPTPSPPRPPPPRASHQRSWATPTLCCRAQGGRFPCTGESHALSPPGAPSCSLAHPPCTSLTPCVHAPRAGACCATAATTFAR